MAKRTLSAAQRRLLRFERQQSCRIVALGYLLISMTSCKAFIDNARYATYSRGTVSATLTKKRAQFLRVTTALVKSFRKEFDQYEEKS